MDATRPKRDAREPLDPPEAADAPREPYTPPRLTKRGAIATHTSGVPTGSGFIG